MEAFTRRWREKAEQERVERGTVGCVSLRNGGR